MRCALGLVAERRAAIARLAGDIPASNGGGEQPAEPRDHIGGAAAAAEEEEEEEEEEEALPVLPVLPDPVPREAERVLARFGLIGEGVEPVFTPGGRYPLAGLLLALPALDGTGLLQSARAVYGRLKNGFYGLETVLVLLVFLALLREPRAEGTTRVPPAALGRVLGLDRAPEVKTIRRKLGESPPPGKRRPCSWRWPGTTRAAVRTTRVPLLDGHTRAYFGTREVQKTHIARMKLPGPATEETWVTGASGDPLLVVMAEPCHRWPPRSNSSCRSCARSAAPAASRCCALTGAAGPATCSPASSTPGFTCSPTAKPGPARRSPPSRTRNSPLSCSPGTTAAPAHTTSPTPTSRSRSPAGSARDASWTCGRSPAATRASRCTSSPPAAPASCPPRPSSTGWGTGGGKRTTSGTPGGISRWMPSTAMPSLPTASGWSRTRRRKPQPHK